MNLRQALIEQAPSLTLQRAAQAEIARLDAELNRMAHDLACLRHQAGERESAGRANENACMSENHDIK